MSEVDKLVLEYIQKHNIPAAIYGSWCVHDQYNGKVRVHDRRGNLVVELPEAPPTGSTEP